MSTYNKDFAGFLTTAGKIIAETRENTSREPQGRNLLQILCRVYTEHFPGRKIYIAVKLGKRLSYLTGAGKELYLEPEVIEIQDKYVVFIETKSGLLRGEKEEIATLFSSVLAFNQG